VRAIVAAAAVVLFGAMPAAHAGTNSSSSTQSGSASSGNAVGGPSIGVSRAGDVRVVATNVSGGDGDAPQHSVSVSPGEIVSTNVQGPSSATSGDASGSNTAATFVGLDSSPSSLADVLLAAVG
jgi:hypothetical protein